MAALSTPLPITVIGPLSARDVQIVKEGDGYRATLVEPMLMGIVPLSTLTFKMTPGGDKLYHITEFQLPKKLELFNSVTLGIGQRNLMVYGRRNRAPIKISDSNLVTSA